MATKTTKAKKKVPTAFELATDLLVVRKTIADNKKVEAVLAKQLLAAFKMEGITDAGEYSLTQSSGFKVAVEELALPFALERGLTTINVAKVHKVFQLDSNLRFEDPLKYGFEVITTEKITPRKGAYDDEE